MAIRLLGRLPPEVSGDYVTERHWRLAVAALEWQHEQENPPPIDRETQIADQWEAEWRRWAAAGP